MFCCCCCSNEWLQWARLPFLRPGFSAGTSYCFFQPIIGSCPLLFSRPIHLYRTLLFSRSICCCRTTRFSRAIHCCRTHTCVCLRLSEDLIVIITMKTVSCFSVPPSQLIIIFLFFTYRIKKEEEKVLGRACGLWKGDPSSSPGWATASPPSTSSVRNWAFSEKFNSNDWQAPSYEEGRFKVKNTQPCFRGSIWVHVKIIVFMYIVGLLKIILLWFLTRLT